MAGMLEDIANHLRVRVITEPPLVGQLGEYDHYRRTIRLHPRLSGLLQTSVLAHELGHAAYGHTTSTPLTEQQADHFAQWLQVPFCDYLTATAAHPTAQGVAHELGVLPATITDYARRVPHDEHGP